MQRVLARIGALEEGLSANTDMTAATRRDIHELRNDGQTRALHMTIIEKSIAVNTAATDALKSSLDATARKAEESHTLTVEIRDLLRAGKISVSVMKWAAGIVSALLALGAAMHLWPK